MPTRDTKDRRASGRGSPERRASPDRRTHPRGSTPEEDRDAAPTPSHVCGEPAWQLTIGKLELADQPGLFPEGRSEGRFKSTASWARPSRAARGSARRLTL